MIPKRPLLIGLLLIILGELLLFGIVALVRVFAECRTEQVCQ